ncbi:unnamed protein product [Paramecium octaurelia]|uniref:Uncharacterized protein n=1 Tax=Paramecium octaurelia TaxID=43137 RepID=A0A8S1X8C6_PAROT|nr:unnamed protein product [Paramecium octaurelia]
MKCMVVIKSQSNKLDLLVVIPEQRRKSIQLICKFQVLEIQNQQRNVKTRLQCLIGNKYWLIQAFDGIGFHLYLI